MKTNEELQKDVMEELKWESALAKVASQIGVTANDGVITLTGRVESYSEKLAAEKAAQRVSGVKVVAEDIKVIIQGISERTDTDIAIAVKNALKWHTQVDEDHIEIKVEKGWVYLDGNVEWDYQKKAAESAIENLVGVHGVINRIEIKNSINVKDIKTKISRAFHRSATLDAGNITIEISEAQVTLRGKVKSLAEKKEAENAVWASPGVNVLVNKIEVDINRIEYA